jgi:hypothetical protein
MDLGSIEATAYTSNEAMLGHVCYFPALTPLVLVTEIAIARTPHASLARLAYLPYS